MNGLHEWQRDFARSVLQDEVTVVDRIKPNGLEPVQRLAVYRNNTFLGLTEALREGYPVVNRLVGDGFFNGLAKAYVRRHPPDSGCLLEYGTHFPAFVAEYPPAQGLPYLPDVARLERIWQEAFHEAAEDGMDLSALAAVPTGCYGALRFRLHPTARWMVSDYPALHIWEVNQPGFDGDDRVSLEEGGCRLLVFRPALDVVVLSLAESDYRFLTALSSGMSLTEAVELVWTADTQFDVLARLGHWLNGALITDFYLTQNWRN
jgi:hypothetical protein